MMRRKRITIAVLRLFFILTDSQFHGIDVIFLNYSSDKFSPHNPDKYCG